MTPIVYLDQQIKQACPNAQGVSIGQWDDKRTWKILGPVTQAEKDAAMAIFLAFDKVLFEATQPLMKTVEERLSILEAKVKP